MNPVWDFLVTTVKHRPEPRYLPLAALYVVKLSFFEPWRLLEAARGQLEGARGQVAVAEGNLAAARAAVVSAGVAVAQAELALARTVVTMPLDGRVVSRSVEVGQRVDPMTPLVVVQRSGWPEVRISVPLDQLAHLGLGADGTGAADLVAELVADLGDGRKQRWLAEGRAVAPVLDERNPVVHLLAQSAAMPGEQATGLPVPGQFLRVQLFGKTDQDVIPVPRRAVQPDGRVLVARPSGAPGSTAATLEARELEVLQRTADQVLVSAGLEAGELLILTPPPVVVEGMALTTRAEGAAPTVSTEASTAPAQED